MENKILLINPHPLKDREAIYAPLGLLAISSLICKDYDVKIVSERTNSCKDNVPKIMEELQKGNVLCIGITMMTGYQIENALKIIRKIKEKYDTPIVVGGYHPSILPDQTLQNKHIDIVVIGQSEITFKELVDALAKKRSLKGIKGIYFKEDGKIIRNARREETDINNFPPLPYDLIDIEEYVQSSTLPKGRRMINYMSSHSCPFKCSFCVEPILYKKWYGLSAEKVVEDIINLVKNYQIDAIEITDSNFFVDKERVRKICKLLIEKNIGVNWGSVNGRVSQLVEFDEELWDLLQKSNCQSILIGAESGSQKILDLINKQSSVEAIITLANITKKYNITLVYSFMTGFPIKAQLEKDKNRFLMRELNKTLDLIGELIKIKDDNFIFLFVYVPYPGNELFNLAVKCGFKQPQKLEEWAHNLNEWDTPWTTEKFRNLVSMLHEFYFPYISSKYAEGHINKYKIIQALFHKISIIRFRYRFFVFPVEYKLFRIFINLRAKKEKI